MQTLLNYADYRDFIRDRFDLLRAENPHVSFQYCAKRLKTGKSYLKLVLEKKRHISMAKVNLLSDLIKLNARERQEFVFLYLRDQSKDPALSSYFQGIVEGLQGERRYGAPALAQVASQKYETTFLTWMHMALETLVGVEDFRLDFDWMHARLGRTFCAREEVERCWNELVEQGILKVTDRGVEKGEFIFRNANPFDQDRFAPYRVGVEIALEVIKKRHPGKPRSHYMMCLGISKEDAEHALSLSMRLRDELIALSKAAKKRETVVFVSNNMFNLYQPEETVFSENTLCASARSANGANSLQPD